MSSSYFEPNSKQNNKESKYLDSYVKDRKKWLNMVCEHYNIKGNEIQMKDIPKVIKETKKTMEYISNENTELQQLIISLKKRSWND